MALTSNKFNLITYTQIPHKCASCGIGATGEPDFFIDFGVQIDWEGAIYLCIRCGAEMARLLNFMSPEDVAKLNEGIDNLVKANHECIDTISSLTDELSHYRALYGRLPVPEQADEQSVREGDRESPKPSDRFA